MHALGFELFIYTCRYCGFFWCTGFRMLTGFWIVVLIELKDVILCFLLKDVDKGKYVSRPGISVIDI